MIDYPDYAASSLRLLVMEALRTHKTKSLLPMLGDEDVIVRSAVARELQIRGEREAFEYTLKACGDPRNYVREIAAFTLGQFGTPTYPFRAEALPKLSELAVDASGEVRAAAVSALGHLHAREYENVILASATDSESDVRASAAFALGYMSPTPDVVHALEALLLDPDEGVREWAEFGIESINGVEFKFDNG